MKININDYLDECQRRDIAKKVYTEKISKEIDEAILRVEHYGSLFERVCNTVVDRYADVISKQYEDRVVQFIEDELNRTSADLPNYDDSFRIRVVSALSLFAGKLITEKQDELRPVIYEKLIESCDELLFSQIVSKLFRQLDLDSAIKHIAKDIMHRPPNETV